MKEKTVIALNALLHFTRDNFGFVLIWALSLAIILKLACA